MAFLASSFFSPDSKTTISTREFYCNSLFDSLRRNIENHLEEIKILKREDAKSRRREKIVELLKLVTKEISEKCSHAKSFSAIMADLKKIEADLVSEKSTLTIPDKLLSSSSEDNIIQPNAYISKNISSPSNENEYKLNPGAAFELTLIGGDKNIAKTVRNILDDGNLYDNKKRDTLLALFAAHNLKIKEVEEYKRKYGGLYFSKLEELKRNSAEYTSAGERDKEDIMEGFREIAIEELYEHANSQLEILFENEPSDFSIDDELIKTYGFESVQTYIRYADDLQKIRVFPSDHYSRISFEKLVEQDLAIRGAAIPLNEVLSTLTLKDLNELAGNPEKPYKRKALATDYLLNTPNIEEKIGSKISLRELFKLKLLPEKYSQINIKQISDSWRYLYEVISILIDTHRNIYYTEQALRDKQYAKSFKVECWNSENIVCPRSKEFIGKEYPITKPPKIPAHIGCNCMLRQNHSF